MRLSILINLVFALHSFAAPGEDFVVYEAQHRPAGELEKAGAGLGNGARVSMLGTKVVVYGTKAQRDGVLALFGQLDHKVGNFAVRFRLAGHAQGARDSAGVGINGGAIHAAVSAGTIEGDVNSVQEVLVSDGGTAKLYADSGIYPKTVTVHLRSIASVGAHVEIREADASAVGEQAIVTELDVPLKEWRSIGGIRGNEVVRTGQILGRTKRSGMSAKDVQIRVEAQ